jgi:hypothetical protein
MPQRTTASDRSEARLAGLVAIVTGASAGIGQGVASLEQGRSSIKLVVQNCLVGLEGHWGKQEIRTAVVRAPEAKRWMSLDRALRADARLPPLRRR